jgi:hypothetical protein
MTTLVEKKQYEIDIESKSVLDSIFEECNGMNEYDDDWSYADIGKLKLDLFGKKKGDIVKYVLPANAKDVILIDNEEPYRFFIAFQKMSSYKDGMISVKKRKK